MGNNPVSGVDLDGGESFDFVKGKNGKIYWDNNANSQETTKEGEIYIGKTINFNFMVAYQNVWWLYKLLIMR